MRGTELIAITEGTARLATSSGIFKQVYLLSNTSDDPGEPNITIRSTITCGWLGNLDSRKGVLRFIDAIAALRKAGLPVSGRIAGGPTAELSVADVKAYSTTAGVGDVIHVIGHVGDAEKHHFFSSLDLFIYLTRHDLAPLVLIEAMSHGVIPIAFDTGGIREMMGRAFEQNVIPADSSTEQCHSTVTELVSRYAERPAFFLEHRRSARNRYLNEYSETAFQMRCKLIFFPTALTLDLTGSKNEQSNRQPAQGTLESSP
jgi:glycosyltransferase involved in cell wall biosynthesis